MTYMHDIRTNSLKEMIERITGVKTIIFTSKISHTSRFYYIRVPRKIGMEHHREDVLVILVPITRYYDM